MAETIVEAHGSIGGPEATGIRFDPPTTDAFERAKVNADRIFRWLDDGSKDTNLLPVNFLPSILAALPMEDRISLVNEILGPVGLVVRRLAAEGGEHLTATRHLVTISKEVAEAQSAVANLIDGATVPELQNAERELADAERAIQMAREDVAKQLNTTLRVVA
ncbi:toxin YdaT family protein [Cupriavidus sp. RAF12]|uniref:toxin YdaT family protein n=1 Tax=Cupriavidus sp. RAF12 TaxID=3233050 RepID=UPI003F935F53